MLLSNSAPPSSFTADDHKYDLEAPGSSTLSADSATADWTEAEERAVRWKLDLIIMPLLWLGFYVFQLERGNVSNALTSTFLKDVGLTQDEFNTGSGVLYLGIVLLEIPSNVMLNKFSAQKWLSFQIFCFGIIATFQAWQDNYASYLVTRILLGITECGYIPGSLYFMSMFFKRSELGRRIGIFFSASATATATTGLLASGILPLSGKDGLAGWQWLFIIEGCMALFVAVMFVLFLPHSPIKPTALLFPKWQYFSERERHILLSRVVLDDAQKTDQTRSLTWPDIRSTLSSPRLWPHVMITMAVIPPVAAIATYSPTLIKSFGFSTLKANALSSVGGWILVVNMILFGYLSDRLNLRGPLVISAVGFLWVWWVVFEQVVKGDNKWAKYAFIILIGGYGQVHHSLNASWISLNQFTPQQRSVAMAVFVMGANTAAAVGSQIMRASDAPSYPHGFTACVCLVSAGLLFAILQHAQYRWSNEKLARSDGQQVGLQHYTP